VLFASIDACLGVSKDNRSPGKSQSLDPPEAILHPWPSATHTCLKLPYAAFMRSDILNSEHVVAPPIHDS
jgi:hypothetical protein